MTIQEAIAYASTMTAEQVAQKLVEHHRLKQALCAQTLGVPTGAEDWILRAIRNATKARHAERTLFEVMRTVESLISEARYRVEDIVCGNCLGTGLMSGESSCACCKGTGRRRI